MSLMMPNETTSMFIDMRMTRAQLRKDPVSLRNSGSDWYLERTRKRIEIYRLQNSLNWSIQFIDFSTKGFGLAKT